MTAVLAIAIGIDGRTFYYDWNPTKRELKSSATALRVYIAADGSAMYGSPDGEVYTWD